MTTNLLTWFGIAACLVLSFLLSGMEAGVFALSRLRVRQQMRAGRPSARLLHGFLENPENFLWTILVGNTLVNFAILGWVVATLHDSFDQRRLWFVVIFGGIVFLFYALFDLLPKMLFRFYPNRLCMMSARPFRLMHFAVRPLVFMVERVSAMLLRWTDGKAFSGHLFGNREELRQVMQESAQGFSSEERAMINRVLDLQSLTVRQITKPLAQAVMVSAQTPTNEVLTLARERGLTRLPVWETRDGQQHIVGLVALNTLLFQPSPDAAKPVADHVKPALYLDEDQRLEVALRRMQRSAQRLAVVVGRDQREVGIVSLEDILKAVFGEVKL
jgi:CBS domain containing-hemolysin-like protein